MTPDYRRGLERAMEICEEKYLEAVRGEKYWIDAKEWQRAESKKIARLICRGLRELIYDELQKGAARDGKASKAKRGR